MRSTSRRSRSAPSRPRSEDRGLGEQAFEELGDRGVGILGIDLHHPKEHR